MSDVTNLINIFDASGARTTVDLLPLVYQELRSLARAQITKERPEHTLQATALVHEAYLRLFSDSDTRWENRGHFFAAAAEAMRRILVEHARRKNSIKRGGNCQRVEYDDLLPISAPCDNFDDLLSLDEALARFELQHADKAELVKLLYFAGLNLEEAAVALGISRSTAYRRWMFSRAWLFDAIQGTTGQTRHVDEH
jgi:RNA polymerase sigma factor (TIGR02999 family)